MESTVHLHTLLQRLRNCNPGYRDLASGLHSHTGNADIIGVTGSPGAGRSTLVDEMVATYWEQGLLLVSSPLIRHHHSPAGRYWEPISGWPRISARWFVSSSTVSPVSRIRIVFYILGGGDQHGVQKGLKNEAWCFQTDSCPKPPASAVVSPSST